MRRIIALLLLLALLLTGCGKQTNIPQADFTLPETTTLMIYMIGSDLEAQAGAATRDLQEILESGVNREQVNVVVYAGGSPHWHNENAMPENHTLLWLTDAGFQQVAAVPTSSMGQADCLANFLTYAHDNFPADHYALILWNHGDGPVIGYGKDMLFDNDSLTLLEMQQALSSTPFREEKLEWVGFDACLMASAELCAVWADYADYLVASQEVEPSFGWDYSFLSRIGDTDTISLLKTLTDTYLQNCLSYYEDRGYDHRDTTLSCLDLSMTPALREAVDALFSAASADNYHAVTARRVQTRALGRATTGSEYDLIDLQDLTLQFSDLFPEESRKLQQVLQNMVVSNSTNADGCGGLSLYYPFYNKYYFQESWGEIYHQLGVFPQYLGYLQGYETTWLSDSLLVEAASATPRQTLANTYTLQLSEAQQEAFASAKYYILVRDGEEYFTRIFVSPDVTNEKGLLTANFGGNVIYVRNDLGQYQIPVTIAHDAVGDQSRYSIFTTLTNYSMSLLQIPEDFETRMQSHRFSLSLDKTTGDVSVTSLVPYDHSTDSEVLAGGKLEETDLSQWASCFFLHDDHRYLSRYENGAVMPVDQWPVSTLFSGYEYPTENGLEFVYAPLAAGEYYLLFEVEDTQGNRYCSELLPIETTGTLPALSAPDPIHVNWEKGEQVLLAQHNGVTVWLNKIMENDGTDRYLLEASNTNDFSVNVQATALYCGDVFCDEYFNYVTVPPGETVCANYSTDLGTAHELGMLSETDPLRLSLTMQNSLTGAYMMYEQPICIALSDAARIQPNTTAVSYNSFHSPVLGIQAAQQLLLQTDTAKVTLLGLGGNGKDNLLRGAVCIENLGNTPLSMLPEALVLDGVYITVSGDYGDIPAHSRGYYYFSVLDSYRKQSEITSAQTVRLLLQHREYSPLFTGNTPAHAYWCDVALTQSAAAGVFREGDTVLYEENGVRVCLKNTESGKNKTTWLLSIRNESDQDICLNLADIRLDGEPVAPGDSPVHISHSRLGAHQACVSELEYYYWDEVPAEEITFSLRVMDFNREAILFTGTNPVALSQP